MAVLCRHCGEQLTQTGNGVWTDFAGFPGCVKGALAPLSGPVLHQPMPEGLRGSPGG